MSDDVTMTRAQFVAGQKAYIEAQRALAAESRARAIRAVVAAQWAVACQFFCGSRVFNGPDVIAAMRKDARTADGRFEYAFFTYADRVGALPTAEQIVDGDA